MRLFDTHWHPQAEAGARMARLVLACALLLSATACVTRGTHLEEVGRLETMNQDLERRVENLTRANSSLDAERIKLADELEDLHQERATLARDVSKLQETKDLLTEHLRERDEQVNELSKVSSTYEALVDDLQSDLTAGRIQIEQLRDGIRLNLPQDVLFASGSAKLQNSGRVVIRKVAERLKTVTHRVEVQGHSDNVPVSGRLASRYGSNWELAVARASQVVRLFESSGVEPGRMVAISFGEHAPVGENATPEGRARNRRIEIRLIPVDGAD